MQSGFRGEGSWELGVGSWEFEQKIKGFKQRWEFSGDNAAKSETFAELEIGVGSFAL